jgi:hypothetical protein
MTSLVSAYEAAFVEPMARHVWNSRRARRHWLDLEGWHSALAGPVSAIARRGECTYVYERDDEYFRDVSDPPSLHARLKAWLLRLAAGVESFVPADDVEKEDQDDMRRFVRAMADVIEDAMEMESQRFERARTPRA